MGSGVRRSRYRGDLPVAQTYIPTAAVISMADGDDLAGSARSAEIMADAAVEIVSWPAKVTTGNCFIDAELLTESGAADLSRYGGGANPIPDIFLD